MNLALVFSIKHKWSEHYFSIWCSENIWKMLSMNHFLLNTIFFTKINISFFNLCSDLFLIIAKKPDQIRNNVVLVVARLLLVFCCTLMTGRCNTFQHISQFKGNRNFFNSYFQTMLFLATMVQCSLKCEGVFFASDKFPGIFFNFRFIGAKKLYSTHYLCVVIILFNVGL